MSAASTDPRARASSPRDPESLLAGLNAAQRVAVQSTATPLCILAGAGSGKTRVLTRRIAYRIAAGTADPARVLALTFTRKAAGELGKRLGQLGVRERVAAGTFHAIAFAQLRQWWADTGQREPRLVESKMRVLAPLLASQKAGSVQPVDIASEIEWAKARLLTPATYAAGVGELDRRPPLGVAAMTELYRNYEDEKQRKGLVDFDDLLLQLVGALESDREFAARQRWRFRHLFVDEYQDVNPAQHRLLNGWLGESLDLCVVGDPNQAIYAWNGADPRFLTEFANTHRGCEVVRLEDNYRSTPQILTVADAVLGLGLRDTRPLTPHCADGPVPTVTAYPSDLEEAKHIARALRDRHNARVPWRHLAVLTRTNAQTVLFEAALRAVGIPFRVKGNVRFAQQPVVRAALAGLRTGAPNISFEAKLRDLEELADDERTNGTVGPEGTNERADLLDALVARGHEFVAIDTTARVGAFEAWLVGTDRSSNDAPDAPGDFVELTTFHRAKGLEWPVVFVAGLERGYVPIGQASDDAAWAEERRLLYVAVTRAERELHCSWAQSRTFGTRTTGRAPSPWLPNIVAARDALADPALGDWRAVLHASRARLAAAKAAGLPGIRGTKGAAIELGAGADPTVFTALKEWRARMARASGVPAFLIFHDTTLAALAEACPADTASLLTVPGIGGSKSDRWGDSLLTAIRDAVTAPVGGRAAATVAS